MQCKAVPSPPRDLNDSRKSNVQRMILCRKICWLISYFERFQFNVLHRFSLEYLVIFRSSRQIFEFMINTFSIFMIWNHHCVTVSNSKMSVSMWRVEKHLTWTQTKNNDERSLFYDILWTNYYS